MPRFASSLVALVLSLLAAAPAAADAVPAGVTWSRGASLGAHSGNLTCPALTLCAVNDLETVLAVERPLTSAPRIKRIRSGQSIESWSVYCDGSPLLCLAGTRNNRIAVSTHPTRGRRASFRTVARIPQGVSNIRCSGTFCAAGGARGFAFSATPAKPGSWVRHASCA